MFIIKIKKEALFMKESIKQEMQRRVLQQDLVGENALIEYYQNGKDKNIRFFYIEDCSIKDEHVASDFEKIGEVTDSEIGLTRWYSINGKRVKSRI